MVSVPLPCPDSSLTTAWCATVLTCTQALAMAWLEMTVCTVLWMKPVTALVICGPNVVSSVLIRGSPLDCSWAVAWSTVPVRFSWLVISFVILSVSTFWIAGCVDQRLHGGHVPAGVGYLVAGPHADHGDRGEHAAEHDQDGGEQGSPAEAAPRRPCGPVVVELGVFRRAAVPARPARRR